MVKVLRWVCENCNKEWIHQSSFKELAEEHKGRYQGKKLNLPQHW